jgi:hypothetical protein
MFEAEDVDEPPEFEAIFTITAPSNFDTLTMVLPQMERESVMVDPPSSEYVWDYHTNALPANLHMIAYLDGVVVAYDDTTLVYTYNQTPSGTFTLELHP